MKLNAEFYQMPATEAAPLLCGKLLCVKKLDGTVIKRRITETECYFGEEDTACHAHKGRTKRTETLYSRGGVAYVYLCYGMHELLNVITGAQDHPEGVLIRGVEGANGPGRLTKLLGIDRSYNGISFFDSDIIWCEDDGFSAELTSAPRIGIAYAEKADRDRKLRFTVANQPKSGKNSLDRP